jgi:hypothetical protein
MATISSCPRCSQLIAFPEGYAADAPMRCPLCQSEYPLDQALALVPPELIPVAEPAETEMESPEPEDAAPPPDTATDFLAGLARLEAYSSPIPAEAESDVETAAAKETVLSETEPFSPIITEESEATDQMPLPSRHRRKSKSALRMLLETILGGVAGLLIAYYALWWIRGERCGLPRIHWLPFLPHAQSTDPGMEK